MRLFYQHFDGQDPLARDGIVAGLRMLTLREVVEEYLEREQARACEARNSVSDFATKHTLKPASSHTAPVLAAQ